LNCKQDKYCRQFLGALPNPTGYIENALFPEIFTQYLGLPSPSCEPLAGGYIGKHPQYSIASSNTVPGGGFTVAHDNHENTLNDILNTAGLRTIKEAANIFHGKVSATHHDAYLENFIGNSDSNRRGIIPDILVQNYPVSQDDITQIRTASAHTKPAIIEIKGLQISPNTYPATIQATDSHARRIPKEYRKKPIVSIPLLHLPKLDLSKQQMDQPDLLKRHFILLLQEVLFPFVLEPLEKPTHRLTNLSSNLQTLLQKLHTADNYCPIPSSLDVVLILFFIFSSIMFSEFSLLKRMQGTS
jgi:hypothetical protein